MDDVFIYYVDFPDNVNEVITPCLDGYTLYINKKLPREAKMRAYKHAMRHVALGDYARTDIQEIEGRAHYGKNEILI